MASVLIPALCGSNSLSVSQTSLKKKKTMATNAAAATTTTGQSIPNVVEEDDEAPHHRQYRSRVANLTQLIDVELVLLIESFEEAKRRIDPVIAQINEARNKFDQLRQQRTSGGGRQIMEMVIEELRELKQTTGKLKSKIPFNLIAPEYQPASDPNVILQPRPNPRKPTNSKDNPDLVVDEELLDDIQLPTIPDEDLDSYVSGYDDPRSLRFLALWCFLAFPEGAFIKASLLSSFMFATWYEHLIRLDQSTFKRISSSIPFDLVSEGFIKSVCKKHCSTTVYGFWMDPRLRHSIKDRLSIVSRDIRPPESLVISSCFDGEEDIFYRGSADPSIMPSYLDFLHLGKWQRSPTHHIEMPDPNLYFKYYSAANLRNLKCISFRGVSVMKELPGFITHLLELKILDLKACHHLEVIPSNIGNLGFKLTHLDMSECYFLDHMPTSLSHLVQLRVLKGFFVGDTNNAESCTLQDLSSLRHLIKLNIYTSLKTFPSEEHLTILQGFKMLRNLTICWGGCSTSNENRESKPKKTPTTHLQRLITRDPDLVVQVKEFWFNLEKLDLRGVPDKGTRNWLRPSNFGKLKKLYIRGGQLSDLMHIKEARKDKGFAAMKMNDWRVKILRLRHLNKLQMDWNELQHFFPKLVSLEKVDCPNLTSFPCDDNGFWTMNTAQPDATTSSF